MTMSPAILAISFPLAPGHPIGFDHGSLGVEAKVPTDRAADGAGRLRDIRGTGTASRKRPKPIATAQEASARASIDDL